MSCSDAERPHPRRRHLRTTAITAALVLLLTACGDATEPPAAPQPTGTPAPEASAGAGSAAAATFSIADVLRRYPTCDAIGTVLGSELDGMALDETSTVDAEGIHCRWLPATIAGQRSRTKGISVDPNGGAGDVTQPDVVATIGGRQVQDAVLAARGGTAWVMPGEGDLRTDVTTVEVPGARVGVSDSVVNAAPTLTGAVAVAAAKQLLGLS